MQGRTHIVLLTARIYDAGTVVAVTAYVLGAVSERPLALRT